MASSTGGSQNISPATPTLPTFLDTDPYPSNRDGRPLSAGSTATNATSEFGDDYRSAKDRNSNVPSTTGPVGEPGLPPSRPTSIGTDVYSQAAGGRRTSLQPPSSRRGFGSRPNTSTSKTHVPTLAAQGFFRPMSSQKLQAQRNQIPSTSEGQKAPGEVGEGDESSKPRHRYSNASINTLKDARSIRRDEDVPPLPVSRGTQVTTEGENTAASVTSATPLQMRQERPQNLDLSAIKGTNVQPEKTPRSERSLRASLGIGSRTSKQEQERRPSPGLHEKLGSHTSLPNGEEGGAGVESGAKPTKSAGKNYEYFAGNMLFCLSGRLMNTRARPLNLVTLILTVAPAALFGAFSAPWLWLHISPALPIVFAYFFYVTLSSFLHAAVSDAGILPRNLHPHPPNPEEERDPLTVGPQMTEWVMVKTFPAGFRSALPGRPNDPPEYGDGRAATAMEVPTKYCRSCNIWRPPRAHHCRVCDACMETQDHHCVWLNNCVGRRNYRFFFAYVSNASVLALMLLAFSLIHVIYYGKRNHISFVDSITGRTQERVGFAMFLYAVLALPYPGSLFLYHLFLTARGETTREYLNSHKFMKKDRHRPFTQTSWLRNWISVLVRPRSPTYLQFKHAYQPGDVRLGYTVPKRQRKKNLKNRYSVQGNGGTNGNNTDVEMKALPPAQGQQPSKLQAKSAGGLAGPVNSTPRQ